MIHEYEDWNSLLFLLCCHERTQGWLLEIADRRHLFAVALTHIASNRRVGIAFARKPSLARELGSSTQSKYALVQNDWHSLSLDVGCYNETQRLLRPKRDISVRASFACFATWPNSFGFVEPRGSFEDGRWKLPPIIDRVCGRVFCILSLDEVHHTDIPLHHKSCLRVQSSVVARFPADLAESALAIPL